ncbi:MAG: GNAT family N-acetyltransferase [Yoonia sp.]|nr:GNAT family N-acetyltransferase [Yoonia sp.]
MTQFRPATTDDIPAMTALWLDGWHTAHAAIVPAELTALRTESSFADRLLRDLSTTRVATIAGHIAGFHIIKDAEVYQFYVGANAQGTGLALALMQDAESILRSNGIKTGWLACSIGNDRAAAFYRKAGWGDAGSETLDLDTSTGTFPLTVWRFEKTL